MSARTVATEMARMLDRADRGEMTVTYEKPWPMLSGDARYVLGNGWHVTIFNDVDEWDYVSRIEDAEGRELFDASTWSESDGLIVTDWVPRYPERWGATEVVDAWDRDDYERRLLGDNP